MKVVLVINGGAGVGKDSFVNCVSKYANTQNFSSIDYIKELALEQGWNGVKDEAGRLLLSTLKKQHTDKAYRKTMEKVFSFYDSTDEIIFVHIREIDEIKQFVEDFPSPTTKTVLVKNPNVLGILSNDSDKYVEYYDYDFLLNNDGDINALDRKAKGFVEYLRGEFDGK